MALRRGLLRVLLHRHRPLLPGPTVRGVADQPLACRWTRNILEKRGLTIRLPVFVQGQESGEFAPGDPRQLLCWYMSVVNSLILQEQGDEEYGFPDVDVLMRILTK